MKYKKAVLRSAVILCILALSVCAGFVFQLLFTSYEKKAYPREYEEFVCEYSAEYGVPEYVIYAVIKVESGYDSGAESSAGAIGLMQIMPDTFNWLLSKTGESYGKGMLYDPETNIKYGAFLLSQLYLKYGAWDTAFAAYNAGISAVDGWLESSEYTDENGRLAKIPYEETEKYVKKVDKAVGVYKRLYYEQ